MTTQQDFDNYQQAEQVYENIKRRIDVDVDLTLRDYLGLIW